MNIGDNIKKIRKSKKITQVQLANIIDKSESTIQKYESNSVTPDFTILTEIAKALNCTLLDLLGSDSQIEKEQTVNKNLLEIENLIIDIAEKYGFHIKREYDNDGDGEFLIRVYISYKNKEFKLFAHEFHSLAKRIMDSIIINIIASENFETE